LSDFLASVDGLALTKAFMQIKEPRLRRRIVNLVDQIAGTTWTERRRDSFGGRGARNFRRPSSLAEQNDNRTLGLA
jgi:hypothetical protein